MVVRELNNQLEQKDKDIKELQTKIQELEAVRVVQSSPLGGAKQKLKE